MSFLCLKISWTVIYKQLIQGTAYNKNMEREACPLWLFGKPFLENDFCLNQGISRTRVMSLQIVNDHFKVRFVTQG